MIYEQICYATALPACLYGIYVAYKAHKLLGELRGHFGGLQEDVKGVQGLFKKQRKGWQGVGEGFKKLEEIIRDQNKFLADTLKKSQEESNKIIAEIENHKTADDPELMT